VVQADLKSQTVLVTGANGFVGRALCVCLLQDGHAVHAVVRPSANFDVTGCQSSHIPIIGADTDWTAALAGVTTVIHLAARVHVMRDDAADPLEEFRRVNVAGTERLALSAVASGVKRLVYVSSIKVNGEVTRAGSMFTEADRPSPQDAYGVSKDEAEQALHRIAKQTGLEVVIVRPPLVYGAGVKGNFVQMLKALAKGIPLPLASARNLRSFVYVGNLVDALSVCATHPDAAGKTYLVSDGEDISTPDLLSQLGTAMGHPAQLFPCPVGLLQLAGRLTGKSAPVERLFGSLQVDNGKIRRELDWTPPYTLQQGLRATAEWYRTARL
jgi:nucleoside-diphosphate-sugar epimerase